MKSSSSSFSFSSSGAFRRALSIPGFVFFLGFLTGCAVGPSYHPPKTTVTSSFANTNQPGISTGTNDKTVAWWRGFNDPKLDELIKAALLHNPDLRIATANLREARAMYRFTQSDFFPVVNGNAGYAKTRYSQAALLGANVNREVELYDAGFDATWELDLFGHVRRQVQASSAAFQAAAATRHDVQVSLLSEVARNYMVLRGGQHELAVARQNADNQRETVKITEARLEGGRGTELDVARARAQLSSSLATIPPIETAVEGAIYRLSVLLGQQPTALGADLSNPAPLPQAPAIIAIGTPSELLRRRPDIRTAERQLASATASIGVEVADLFPRVTFNGRLALEARTFSGLAKPGADTWSFGPRITWAALDLGHVRARINAADARTEASLANYEKVVLGALEETENALVDYGRQQNRRDYLAEAAQASATAARLARQRFDNGATDFLTVLDAERVLLEAQNQLAFSQTRTATALVAVYKALGGGWENQ